MLQQFELSIPKNTTFQTVNGCSKRLYQCQQDIELKIDNEALLVELNNGDVFIISRNPATTSGDFDSIMYACHNTNVYQVRNLANLESEKYDLELCLDHVIVECKKFQISAKGNYYFWKVGLNADGSLQYTKHDNLDLTQCHKILAEIPNRLLKTTGVESNLYIKKDTQVEFGKECYKMCDDLCLETNCYRIISSQSPGYYRLNTCESEICANPFESSKITDKTIRLKTGDGYYLNVSMETFMRNITRCYFSADYLYYVSRHGYDINVKDFEWRRRESQSYYCMYNTIQQMRHLQHSADAAVASKTKAFIDDEYHSLNHFLKTAFEIAVRADDLSLMQYLIAAGVDVKAHYDLLSIPIANGKLATVKYLIECGLDPKPSTDRLLELAVKSGQVSMVEYLVAQGLNVTAEWYHYTKLAMQQNHDAMFEYLESLPVDLQLRKKILTDELAIVQKSFNKIVKLTKSFAVNA